MDARGDTIIDSPWMTYQAAAAYLHVSVGTLRNWVSARYVPFARRGRVVRFHRDKLDRWLRQGECHGRRTIADSRTAGDGLGDPGSPEGGANS